MSNRPVRGEGSSDAGPQGHVIARSAIGRFLAYIGPDFALAILFTIALAGLIAAYGASFKWQEGPILISAGIAVMLVAVRFFYRAPSILLGREGARREFADSAVRILRDWGPLIIVMWLVQSLETYTGVIRKTSIDASLYNLDLRLFGVEPTQWISKFQSPLLTDYMAFAYGQYFITPMILATALSLRGRRGDFREFSTAVVLQLGIGFIVCLCLPAGPPRYFEPLMHGGFHPPQLHSYFGLFELQQGAFDHADPLRTRSAFPSFHCSLALITLLYAYKYGNAVFGGTKNLFFWIVLPLVVSLWISTVYLRHHWIPDIAAGLALGLTATLIAPWMRRRWPIHRARQPLDPIHR